MKTFNSVALAGVLVLGLASAAQAQSTSLDPSVPNPANPYPRNPVSTDGTPLARYNGFAGGVYTGRSAYVGPVDGLVGTGVGIGAGAVDTGLGLAGRGVDTGLGVGEDVLR